MLPVQARNLTEVKFPSEKTIPEIFEEQVARNPAAVALIAGSRSFSYFQLNVRANELAERMRQRGVGPQTLVAIALERSHELVIAILAILKAGAAYVPIDPTHPQERITSVLADAKVALVLTSTRIAGHLPTTIPALMCDAAAEPSRGSGRSVAAKATARDLAYVLHTSGSSGKPKGVMVEHRNVVNFFCGMDRAIGSAPGVWLALTNVVFDISVLELLWTLTRGFTVVLHGDEGVQTVADEITTHRVTHLQSTPSLMRLLLMDARSIAALGSLQTIILGGEVVTPALVAQIRQSMKGEIYNAYGPTETTIWSTIHPVGESSENVPIGQPIINTRLYVLNEDRKPVLPGEWGVLFIGGEGVARGYLNQPELTAERFLADPFVEGGRIYDTGDLVRFLPDGNLEYKGRVDSQVKVRGFRVELGEVEATLEQHHSVHQAVVTARDDKFGDKHLVAFVVLKAAKRETITAADLRSSLRSKLPHYMLPSSFVFLERFPLRSSGKIDRDALRHAVAGSDPNAGSLVSTESPWSTVERMIEQVWKEALGTNQIGLHENFFDLGANSLLVAEVHAELEQRMGREFPLVDLFQFPCVADLANHLGGEPAPVTNAGTTRAQRRMEARANRAPK